MVSKGLFKKSVVMDLPKGKLVMGFFVFVFTAIFITSNVEAWTGEIHERVVCDVCGDSSIGPEDHVLEADGVNDDVRRRKMMTMPASIEQDEQMMIANRGILIFGQEEQEPRKEKRKGFH